MEPSQNLKNTDQINFSTTKKEKMKAVSVSPYKTDKKHNVISVRDAYGFGIYIVTYYTNLSGK